MAKDILKSMTEFSFLLTSFLVGSVLVGACAVVYIIERMHRFYSDEMKRLDKLLDRQHKLLVDTQDKLVSKDFTAYSAIRATRAADEYEMKKLNGTLPPPEKIKEGDIHEDFYEDQPLGPMNFET